MSKIENAKSHPRLKGRGVDLKISSLVPMKVLNIPTNFFFTFEADTSSELDAVSSQQNWHELIYE